ncbi:MAG: hypothetical protein V7K83_08085 [Nostoc sp.]
MLTHSTADRDAGLLPNRSFQNGCLVPFGHKGEMQAFAPVASDIDHQKKPPHPAGSCYRVLAIVVSPEPK